MSAHVHDSSPSAWTQRQMAQHLVAGHGHVPDRVEEMSQAELHRLHLVEHAPDLTTESQVRTVSTEAEHHPALVEVRKLVAQVETDRATLGMITAERDRLSQQLADAREALEIETRTSADLREQLEDQQRIGRDLRNRLERMSRGNRRSSGSIDVLEARLEDQVSLGRRLWAELSQAREAGRILEQNRDAYKRRAENFRERLGVRSRLMADGREALRAWQDEIVEKSIGTPGPEYMDYDGQEIIDRISRILDESEPPGREG